MIVLRSSIYFLTVTLSQIMLYANPEKDCPQNYQNYATWLGCHRPEKHFAEALFTIL